ncbi:LytR C-terminal domain-containing protein [Jatrophihabitans sp. DSM 45814]
MSASTTRRPLPALAFLVALSVLTAIVWWRVLHRDDASSATKTTVTHAPTCAATGAKVVLPKPAAVTIKVLNGNGLTGLAASVSAQLHTRGFVTAGTGDANTMIGIGEIHFGPKGKNGATLLSFYVPGAKLVSISRADASVDLVLGQAYKSLATNQTVLAAEARAAKPC